MKCPCCSERKFEECCEPFLKGQAFPESAEKLMRSRYTAFATSNIEYLKNTMASETVKTFNVSNTTKWASESKWKNLNIVSIKKGGPDDKTGIVEFKATYEQEGRDIEHHEVSEFKKDISGRWKFVDGESHTHKVGEGHQNDVKQQTVTRESPKLGRNDPCSCGSGKKFKKCCG